MSPNSPPTLPSQETVARPFTDHNRKEIGQIKVINIEAPCELFEFLAIDKHLLPNASKRMFNKRVSSKLFLKRVNEMSEAIRDEHAKGECLVPLDTWPFTFNHL